MLLMGRDALVKRDGMYTSNEAECTRFGMGREARLERGDIRRDAPLVPFLIQELAHGSHGFYDGEVTASAFIADSGCAWQIHRTNYTPVPYSGCDI